MALLKPLYWNGPPYARRIPFGAALPIGIGRDATNDSGGEIVIGNAVYVDGSGNLQLALGDAIGTARVAGLVGDATIADQASGTYITSGLLVATTAQWDAVTGGAGGLTPGAPYYLDLSTAGRITSTLPTADGDILAAIGEAESTTDLLLRIEPPIIL